MGKCPISHAVCAFPEAVEVLLQAGACLAGDVADRILHQDGPDHWKAVSALIRGGCRLDQWDFDRRGQSPLHTLVSNEPAQFRYALELVRHGGHSVEWEYWYDDDGKTPYRIASSCARRNPGNQQLQLIRELYRARRVPFHAQFISSFDGERLMHPDEIAGRPRTSLIDTALAGDLASLGRLISAGAMVNERDEAGRTLLHLIAMGDRVPNGYQAAMELERHGGNGIDYDATFEGKTALEIAQSTLQRRAYSLSTHAEMRQIIEYLQSPRLADGQDYLFPCMDPRWCNDSGSLRCTCPELEDDVVPDMPGAFPY